MSTTSDRLRQLMSERRLRQVEILEMCKPFCEMYNVKIAKSELSQWVSGISLPGQKKLTILAMALDVSEAWLMGFDAHKERRRTTNEGGPTQKQQELIDLIMTLNDSQILKVEQIIRLVSTQ